MQVKGAEQVRKAVMDLLNHQKQELEGELTYIKAFESRAEKDNFPCLTKYEFQLLEKGFSTKKKEVERMLRIVEAQIKQQKEKSKQE